MDGFVRFLNESGGIRLVTESGWAGLELGNVTMFVVAGALIYLAITKGYEPLLLIPIGFGILLANFPAAALVSLKTHPTADSGILHWVYYYSVKQSGLLPPVIFMGVGVLTDFRPLLARPITFLLGAAAQLGIFTAALGAFYIPQWLFGHGMFTIGQSAAIGIIGGADGPTSIYVASRLAPDLLGPIAVAAYSYMSLVPIIQPPIMRALTTQQEREITMPMNKPVSRTAVILFPIVTAAVASLSVPSSAPLMGMLMFGNLLRESGVTERLKKTAGSSLIDIVTIFLGLCVGATMPARTFLTARTLMILAMGAVAFSFSTFGGVVFAKILNLFLPEGRKLNPCIGAAGVSAVPMAARVVQKTVSDDTDGRVNPLMSAMGPNVAGVIGSAVAAGAFLALCRG